MSEEVLDAGSQTQQADAQPGAEAAGNLLTPTVDAVTDTPASQGASTETAAGDKPATDAAKPTAQIEKQSESKPVVPEKYEFAAPEGQKFNPEVIGAYSEAAREAGLSQDTAQKLLAKMAPALNNAQAGALSQVRKGWYDSAVADKEFGGDAMPANLAIAKRGLDTFGSPALSKMLQETGLGNHPEIIRAFYRAGKAISEDKVVTGRPSTTSSAKSIASTLYDKSARSN